MLFKTVQHLLDTRIIVGIMDPEINETESISSRRLELSRSYFGLKKNPVNAGDTIGSKGET